MNISPSNCCICTPSLRKTEEHAKCETRVHDRDLARRYCRVTGDFAQKKIEPERFKQIINQGG